MSVRDVKREQIDIDTLTLIHEAKEAQRNVWSLHDDVRHHASFLFSIILSAIRDSYLFNDSVIVGQISKRCRPGGAYVRQLNKRRSEVRQNNTEEREYARWFLESEIAKDIWRELSGKDYESVLELLRKSWSNVEDIEAKNKKEYKDKLYRKTKKIQHIIGSIGMR